ncbi:MlaD family protein [Nocardia nepalensis]|uniref:MlaD family protein n=1 Tax=Nocardia nepalensis TaxID=3375448 RepID=UPI003B674020
MNKKLRITRRTAVLAAAVSVALAGAVPLTKYAVTTVGATAKTNGFCAELDDAIGLYVGNPVTQMGYPIGTVEHVTGAGNTAVRVDFSLDRDRTIPADVRALIRSTSILADRSLELVGNYVQGPKLAPGECIPLTRTATPKSISRVVGSTTRLINGITSSDSANLADTITGLDSAMTDSGPRINKLLTGGADLMNNPDKTVADIGLVLGNLAEFTSVLHENTGPLRNIIEAMPATTPYLSDALIGSTDIMFALTSIVTGITDLERNLGGETQHMLDALPSVIHLATTRAPDIAAVLDPIPGLIGLAATTSSGGFGIDIAYRQPMVSLDTPDPGQFCDALNAVAPQSCTTVAGRARTTHVGLLQLALVGAKP